MSAPRRPVWLLATLALLFLVLPLMLGLHWGSYTSTPVVQGSEPVPVTIPAGASFDQVLQSLQEAGLVGNLAYFKLLARLRGADRRVRAGQYEVAPGSTPDQLLALITQKGAHGDITLTVLEGWTLYHTADRVAELGLASREDFIARATDPALLKSLEVHGPSVEGHLFPDTYRFHPNAGADAVLERLVQRHRQVWGELEQEVGRDALEALRRDHKLSSRELLVLASIVEREAVVDEERPVIARVFLNRIKKEMKLQADPTCTYGPTIYLEKASPKLCKDKNSLYSTYVIPGLPPGPISNPGRSSLKAVMQPTQKPKELEYLYFVARPDGRRHTFSKTYQAHRKAIPR